MIFENYLANLKNIGNASTAFFYAKKKRLREKNQIRKWNHDKKPCRGQLKQKTNWICNDNKLLSRWYANQNLPSGLQAQWHSDEKKWIRSADDMLKFGNDFENYLFTLKNISKQHADRIFSTQKTLAREKLYRKKESGQKTMSKAIETKRKLNLQWW